MQNKQLNLPCDLVLGNRNMKVPFVFIGDDAFALDYNFMKAYPVEQIKG